MLAIEPPSTSSPELPSGKPMPWRNHSSTCSSSRAGPWFPPKTLAFMPVAIHWPRIPGRVPAPFTQPQKRGWRLPEV